MIAAMTAGAGIDTIAIDVIAGGTVIVDQR
jgi:hypothetical protein